jgi:hypothetical protein
MSGLVKRQNKRTIVCALKGGGAFTTPCPNCLRGRGVEVDK